MTPIEWVHVGLTALAGFGGVAAGYGYLRAKVSFLSENQEEHNRRLFALEGRGLNLVFKNDCKDMRTDCHQMFCQKMEEIKKEIRTNREIVDKNFKEITLFMGYVRATLESIEKK